MFMKNINIDTNEIISTVILDIDNNLSYYDNKNNLKTIILKINFYICLLYRVEKVNMT